MHAFIFTMVFLTQDSANGDLKLTSEGDEPAVRSRLASTSTKATSTFSYLCHFSLLPLRVELSPMTTSPPYRHS